MTILGFIPDHKDELLILMRWDFDKQKSMQQHQGQTVHFSAGGMRSAFSALERLLPFIVGKTPVFELVGKLPISYASDRKHESINTQIKLPFHLEPSKIRGRLMNTNHSFLNFSSELVGIVQLKTSPLNYYPRLCYQYHQIDSPFLHSQSVVPNVTFQRRNDLLAIRTLQLQPHLLSCQSEVLQNVAGISPQLPNMQFHIVSIPHLHHYFGVMVFGKKVVMGL